MKKELADNHALARLSTAPAITEALHHQQTTTTVAATATKAAAAPVPVPAANHHHHRVPENGS